MQKLHQLVEERTESLEHSLALLKATFESSTDGILVMDLEGTVLNYNSRFIKMWEIEKALVENGSASTLLNNLKYKIKEPSSYIRRMNRLKKNINATSSQKVQLHDKTIIECCSQPYDEFVMLATSLNKVEDAVNVSYRVLASFQKPFRVKNKRINLSTSIGIALYPSDGTTAKQLLRYADLAMYHAKEMGGEQFRFYTQALNLQSKKRLSMESELKGALENGEFFLLYQPQFNVKKQKMLSAEALIRWNHPKKGLVLPMDFIPAAEDSGLIVPMGEWVIEQICKQHYEWQALGIPPIRIAINISIQQLRQYNFVSYLRSVIHTYKVNPHDIDLEITENTILIHQEILPVIKELKGIGVHIVLDDFGTRHSSLSYLKQLQIDGLKIAPAFVRNISHCENDELIIKAIIAMAKSLGFNVTAQGVENQNQTNFLIDQNCDNIQGFHFSQPMPVDLATVIFQNQQ